ncbi:MAG: nucleotidyltransferase domain-containing protein [Planctomycetota bacterium]
MDQALTERLRAFFEKAPAELVCAYLYGSFARGEEHAGSDVDLGLLFRTRPESTLDATPRRIEDALERELGRVVEVVVLNDASSDLVHRVMRDGILVLDRDRSFRLAFEVRSQNEYFDMQPIWLLYRRGSAAG